MNQGELLYVPLGGLGEIGMNTAMFGHAGRWMMVDLGLSFADDSLPGVDLVLPDLTFAEARKRFLDGIVLTHAHEDHYGALPYLWTKLGVPVFCTAFTAAALRRKLLDGPGAQDMPIRVVAPGEPFRVGPFECEYLHMTHSIPEANAVVIRTEAGTILHTGDWKLDPHPLVGEKSWIPQLTALGRDGVLAMLCDSTNVFRPGESGSEAEVRTSLADLVKQQKARVVVTTFASNIARLESVVLAGRESGREIAVVGRSMHRMLEAAREAGYLKSMPRTIDPKEAAGLPPARVLYLCTGSQGEPRSALSRIAARAHPQVRLDRGDTVIFSSKIIPGNERALYNLHNAFVRQGVEVITEDDHFVHVSGHPCRDELEQMYRWIRPRYVVPIHGEARHIKAHAEFARKLGTQPIVIGNGDILRLAPGEPEVIDDAPIGRMALEPSGPVDVGDELYRTRRRLMSHGVILVSLVLDDYGTVLAAPRVTDLGATDLVRGERGGRLEDRITDAIEALDDGAAEDDERVRDVVRGAVRLGLELPRERRPLIEVQITRLTPEVMDQLEDSAAAGR